MTTECNKDAVARSGGKKACDEYPFASARQGGPANYMFGNVSLRLLERDESSMTGPFIREFYRKSLVARDGFSPASRFIAIGIPESDSFFTDRLGNVYEW